MPNYSKLFDLARNLYALPSYNSRYGRALVPLRYFMELTYRCNLQCPYCYVGNNRNKNELTTEEWFKIIEQVPFYGFITLVGGEPLIRKDFIEILEKACKQVFSKVNVVSNGILIDDEIIEAFIRTKMLLLSVSFDGYGHNHDLNRNKDGIFDKIMNNLDRLNSRKKRPMIDIKTIVLKNNLEDLPKLFKLCDSNGFEFLSISFLRNNNLKQNSILQDSFIEAFNSNYPIEKYFDMKHFKEVYKELESLQKHSSVRLRFSPKFENSPNPLLSIEKFFNTSPETPITEVYKPCMFPFSNTFITPSGDMYPCLSMKMGNLKEGSIKEIFNKPHYCCFRKNLKVAKVFGACQMCCELSVKD